MRILQRFVAGGHHFGPGDEVYLAAKMKGRGIVPSPDAVDPDREPWTAKELEQLHAAETEADEQARAAAVQADAAAIAQRHDDKTMANIDAGYHDGVTFDTGEE